MRYLTLILFSCYLLLGGVALSQKPVNIMIVTGGHDFDRTEFFGMFDRMPDIHYTEVQQPAANERISNGNVDDFNLLIFYDMYDRITDAQKRGYLKLFEEHKPMLFLHHSLVSYQDWPEFRDMIGGKYHAKDSSMLSNYHHDEQINVHIEDPMHPVTYQIGDFIMEDETYGNCEILPKVEALLSTDHALSMPVIGWVNSYLGHKIVYLQGGHGPSAYRDSNFQHILSNAIRYCLKTNSLK